MKNIGTSLSIIFTSIATAAPLGFSLPAEATNISIGLNFTSSTLFTDSFFIPPDTMGGVGMEHIVELINGRYSVYDKDTGTRVQTSSLNQFWIDAGVSLLGGSAFDPRIVYDPFSERWFAASGNNLGNSVTFPNYLVAVSNASDPTLGWTGLEIETSGFADFPTLGFNADGVFLGGNTNALLVLPKDDLINGRVVNKTLFEPSNIFVSQPVINLDNTGLPATFLSNTGTSSGSFRRLDVTGDITSPTLEESSVSVEPFFSRFSAEQPGPKQNLEIFGGSIFHANLVQQNGAIWGVQTVNNGGRAAIRWFEIDADTNETLQEGLIADDQLEFYYGSIAVNEFDEVAIGFSGSSKNQFVSSFAVVGDTIEGQTIFGNPLLLKEGVADYEVTFGAGRNRWGDYSATVVDPSDPNTFWTFQEFVSAENQWSTQITELKIAPTTVPEPASVLAVLTFASFIATSLKCQNKN